MLFCPLAEKVKRSKGQKVKRSKVTFGDFPFLVEAWKRDCLLVLLEERIVFMMMKEDSIY